MFMGMHMKMLALQETNEVQRLSGVWGKSGSEDYIKMFPNPGTQEQQPKPHLHLGALSSQSGTEEALAEATREI